MSTSKTARPGDSSRPRSGIASLLTLALALALTLLGAPVHAQLAEPAPAPGYTAGAASIDGTGRRYMGREIAQVMGWQGAAWLEREEREREERTDLLLRALDLKPGMTVADVGAGTGYLSRRMARAVGPTGRVLAVDVQPEMIELLRTGAAREGLGNIEPRLGSETDASLPAASVDLAVMVDVYHELAFPHEMLVGIVRGLKPGGRLVFVEYRAEDPKVPIKALHKMSEAQVRREAEVHGLVWERTVGTLPWQHVIVFRRPAAAGTR